MFSVFGRSANRSSELHPLLSDPVTYSVQKDFFDANQIYVVYPVQQSLRVDQILSTIKMRMFSDDIEKEPEDIRLKEGNKRVFTVIKLPKSRDRSEFMGWVVNRYRNDISHNSEATLTVSDTESVQIPPLENVYGV